MKPLFIPSFLKYSLATFLVTLISITACFAQYEQYSGKNKQQPSFGDRIFFGGDFGLQFGTVTVINVSPLAGYKVTDDFSAGIGITYQYYEDKTFSEPLTTSVFGGRLFGEYQLPMIPNFFAHAEYEVLNYDKLFIDPYYSYRIYKKNVTANNILVGGGYRQAIGGRAFVNLLLLYNLTEDENSLYSNPIIRMGVSFGI
jgi:hypothetical protein